MFFNSHLNGKTFYHVTACPSHTQFAATIPPSWRCFPVCNLSGLSQNASKPKFSCELVPAWDTSILLCVEENALPSLWPHAHSVLVIELSLRIWISSVSINIDSGSITLNKALWDFKREELSSNSLSDLEQYLSNINVHRNHLGILLKFSFWFSNSAFLSLSQVRQLLLLVCDHTLSSEDLENKQVKAETVRMQVEPV